MTDRIQLLYSAIDSLLYVLSEGSSYKKQKQMKQKAQASRYDLVSLVMSLPPPTSPT